MPSLTAIGERNPKVDLKLVEEAQALLAERRAKGRPRRGYNLASSHSRHLAQGERHEKLRSRS